jgi:hypothetical protein
MFSLAMIGKARPLIRGSLFVVLGFVALARAGAWDFPLQLITRVSAEESILTPDWVANGKAAALTRGAPEVGSVTLLSLKA